MKNKIKNLPNWINKQTPKCLTKEIHDEGNCPYLHVTFERITNGERYSCTFYKPLINLTINRYWRNDMAYMLWMVRKDYKKRVEFDMTRNKFDPAETM